MSLLFADSFDHYVTADVTKKWSTIFTAGGNTSGSISAATGRRSTQSFRGTVSSSQFSIRPWGLTLSAASGATCVVGMAFSATQFAANHTSTTLNLGDDGTPACALLAIRRSGAAANTTHQVWFRVMPAGTIGAYRGTTLLGTSDALTTSGFQYLEFKVLIHASAGTVEIRKDTEVILNLTSQNTLGDTASATWDQIVVGRLGIGSASATTWDIDDLYVLDGTTSADDPRNDFLNDIRVDVIRANGVGNASDGTPSGGAVSNYTMVDETTANGDTDYNTFTTAGDQDTYAFPDAPVAASDIFGVQVNVWARKEDAGAVTVRAVTRLGGTDYYGSSLTPGTGYLNLRQVWAQKPSDSSDWVDTDINAAEFGMEKET